MEHLNKARLLENTDVNHASHPDTYNFLFITNYY